MEPETLRQAKKRPREVLLDPSIEILEAPNSSQTTASPSAPGEEDELMDEDGITEITVIEKMLGETRQPERKRARVSPPKAKIEKEDTLDYRDLEQDEPAPSQIVFDPKPRGQSGDNTPSGAEDQQDGDTDQENDEEALEPAAANATLNAEPEETKPFMVFQGQASQSMTNTPAPAPTPTPTPAAPPASQRSIASPARSDISLPPPRFSQPVPPPLSQRPRPRPATRPSQTPKPVVVIDITDSPPPARRQSSFTSVKASTTPMPPSASQASQSRTLSQGSLRSQTGSQGTRPAPKFKKHPVHWQLDGNLLVQLDGVRFKLQRSRLVEASQWFEKTCEAINREEAEEHVIMLDGLGFGVDDFATLLETMNNAINYCFKDPPFRTFASVLITSFVLEFADYYAWAARHLREMWFAGNELEHVTQNSNEYSTDEAITSIYLARKCEVKGVLKSAMYSLVRRAGFGQPDEEDEDVEATAIGAKGSPKSKKKPKARLSNADVKRLIHAREHLTSQWTLALAIPSSDLSRCFAPPIPYQKCNAQDPLKIHEVHQKLIHKSGLFEEFIYDPMGGFEVLRSHLIPPEAKGAKDTDLWQRIKNEGKWGNEKVGGHCVECVKKRYQVWGNTRKKVWQNLDVWFGLEGEREEEEGNAAESSDDENDNEEEGDGSGDGDENESGGGDAGADGDQEMADA